MTNGVLRKLDELDAHKSFIINYLLTEVGATLSGAANARGLPRSTIYIWKNSDKEFSDQIDWARQIAHQIAHDFVENKIMQLIAEGSEKLTIFYAATRMRERGYIQQRSVKDVPAQLNDETVNFTITPKPHGPQPELSSTAPVRETGSGDLPQ